MARSSIPARRESDARFGARAVFAGLALALVAVPFGLLLFLVEDRWSPPARVDGGARDDLHALALHHDGLVTVMKVLSTIGSALVYFPLFAAVAAWLVWRRLPRLAAFVVVTVAGSALLNALVKLIVDRARPVIADPVAHANGMSFPSGHAQSAIVAASVLLLVFLPLLSGTRRTAAVAVAVAFVLAIGLARVTLGVHFVSDVLAGYALGAGWVTAMIAAFTVWRRERGRPPVDAAGGLEPGHAPRLAVDAPLRRDPVRTGQARVVTGAAGGPPRFDWGLGHYERTAAQLAPVSDVVVERAAPQVSERVLDLGCGAGGRAGSRRHLRARRGRVGPHGRRLGRRPAVGVRRDLRGRPRRGRGGDGPRHRLLRRGRRPGASRGDGDRRPRCERR